MLITTTLVSSYLLSPPAQSQQAQFGGQFNRTSGWNSYASVGNFSVNVSNRGAVLRPQSKTGVYRQPRLNRAAAPSLAQRSFNMQQLPSGSFSYGFDRNPQASWAGRQFSRGFGGLPATSTASVNLNICDSPPMPNPSYRQMQMNAAEFSESSSEDGNLVDQPWSPSSERTLWRKNNSNGQTGSWAQP